MNMNIKTLRLIIAVCFLAFGATVSQAGCLDDPPCHDGCACIHTTDSCRCVIRCGFKSGKFVTKDKMDEARTQITETTRLEFSARGVPLAEIAIMIDELFPGRVMVPAMKINSVVGKKIADANIGEIAQSLGLQMK